MNSHAKVLVIIPAYNEEENILATARSVEAAGYEYVIINDGSNDATLEVCKNNSLSVIDLPLNLGIGGAVQTGHKFAQEHGYDIDVQFDGDGQHDPDFLPILIEAVMNGADLAIGSRFIGKSDGFQSTAMRRFGKSWLSAFLKIFGRIRVTDPTSGFRACGPRAIKLFCANYPIDYPEPESIALCARSGFKIKEVPVVMHERKAGSSSITAVASVYYMIKVSLAILITCLIYSKKKERD